MSGEQTFLVVIVVGVLAALATVVVLQLRSHHRSLLRWVLNRLDRGLEVLKRRTQPPGSDRIGAGTTRLSAEERSEAELRRVHSVIEDRKQLARDTDISYHLWGFYQRHFRSRNPRAADRLLQAGEWYDVRILRSHSNNGLNNYEFELGGSRYTFVDDEESHGWSDNVKTFSLFLYDATGRCLIEVPVKLKVDRRGRSYSILSDGPRAFLPGDWVNEFIKVKLKHQRLENQEIRDQKHQERLWEIEDLKDRFGIRD